MLRIARHVIKLMVVLPKHKIILSGYILIKSCDYRQELAADSGSGAPFPGSIKSIKNGIFRIFMMAGRALIPRHWKSPITPTIWAWVVEMNHIMRMQELVSIANNNDRKFREVWAPWVEFLESSPLLSFP